jgi:ubiquinone biosynthesis protein UbiJ
VTTTRIPNDAVYRFVMDVAAGAHDVAELATRLEQLVGQT